MANVLRTIDGVIWNSFGKKKGAGETKFVDHPAGRSDTERSPAPQSKRQKTGGLPLNLTGPRCRPEVGVSRRSRQRTIGGEISWACQSPKIAVRPSGRPRFLLMYVRSSGYQDRACSLPVAPRPLARPQRCSPMHLRPVRRRQN